MLLIGKRENFHSVVPVGGDFPPSLRGSETQKPAGTFYHMPIMAMEMVFAILAMEIQPVVESFFPIFYSSRKDLDPSWTKMQATSNLSLFNDKQNCRFPSPDISFQIPKFRFYD